MEIWDRENQTWIELDEPNTAPVLSFGGWVGAVTQTSQVQDCAYDFLQFLNSPEFSIQDVVIGDTGFNVYRNSHVRGLSTWVAAWGEVAEQDAKEYLAAVRVDMENPNVLIDLRIPVNRSTSTQYSTFMLAPQFLGKWIQQKHYR